MISFKRSWYGWWFPILSIPDHRRPRKDTAPLLAHSWEFLTQMYYLPSNTVCPVYSDHGLIRVVLRLMFMKQVGFVTIWSLGSPKPTQIGLAGVQVTEPRARAYLWSYIVIANFSDCISTPEPGLLMAACRTRVAADIIAQEYQEWVSGMDTHTLLPADDTFATFKNIIYIPNGPRLFWYVNSSVLILLPHKESEPGAGSEQSLFPVVICPEYWERAYYCGCVRLETIETWLLAAADGETSRCCHCCPG